MFQAQKMESLSRMAGAIAHRFNNLLMGVIGNLELAKMLAGEDSRVAKKISQAESASHRAVDLGKLMLMYVGQIGTNRVVCSLSDVIEKTLPLVQASAPTGIVFETELDANLPPVEADIASLQHVLMNLASNAWESFEDEQGLIHIETTIANVPETFADGFVENETLPNGDYLCLTVTDNGSGMDKETRERMFDPFYTTKFTGRGLGLSAVLGIVRAHKGGIVVYSEKNISTRISILIPPIKKNTNLVFIKSSEERSSIPQKQIILLVDDENDVREVAKQMLENLGCIVIQAANGQTAKQLMEKHQAHINGVICDIKMPDMNGWETIAAIRNIRSDIPFAMVTGFGLTAADMKNKPEPKVLIQKPYRQDNLLTFLKTLK
jgi:two-component system, cell cycle sensor histidine kinase and response regulator CckA